ncbi:unnamed protein product [Vitrella brassicaformis CCMP3155]|uniref:Uncharacterized protein n=1 Tax=Vitrella brassicaformis (strain CCMP3155) TaxID=1169540 RepID=A0A0G4GGK6_VITBC|nr:unnamed protein product [Vitrella brassicaformis CCMP3155]|eukprot:CEM28776.1 unnamed protein product [Vitrella brassicaformis CCMP3155]
MNNPPSPPCLTQRGDTEHPEAPHPHPRPNRRRGEREHESQHHPSKGRPPATSRQPVYSSRFQPTSRSCGPVDVVEQLRQRIVERVGAGVGVGSGGGSVGMPPADASAAAAAARERPLGGGRNKSSRGWFPRWPQIDSSKPAPPQDPNPPLPPPHRHLSSPHRFRARHKAPGAKPPDDREAVDKRRVPSPPPQARPLMQQQEGGDGDGDGRKQMMMSQALWPPSPPSPSPSPTAVQMATKSPERTHTDSQRPHDTSTPPLPPSQSAGDAVADTALHVHNDDGGEDEKEMGGGDRGDEGGKKVHVLSHADFL